MMVLLFSDSHTVTNGEWRDQDSNLVIADSMLLDTN